MFWALVVLVVLVMVWVLLVLVLLVVAVLMLLVPEVMVLAVLMSVVLVVVYPPVCASKKCLAYAESRGRRPSLSLDVAKIFICVSRVVR